VVVTARAAAAALALVVLARVPALARGPTDQAVSTAAGKAWVEEDGEYLGPKDTPAGTSTRVPVPHPLETLMRTERSALLPALVGQHPRVYLTERELVSLRERAHTTHGEIWKGVLAHLRALAGPPPAPPAQERRAQNAVGLAMSEAALAYKIEGDPRYLQAAKRYMDAAVAYDVWGYTYNKPDIDLAAGHLLFGLGWAYDLLYNELTPAERARYREKLTRQADILYRYFQPRPGRTYAYGQNHLFIPMAGLGVAAYALAGEVPAATQWAALSRAIMGRVLEVYPEDGFFYESFEYWVFSAPWLVLWTQAHAHATGEDLFDRPGFRAMHLYVAHSILPDGKNVFDFGDTFSGPLTRLGTAEDITRTHPNGRLVSNYNLLYKLAARFGSGEMQGVADWMRSLGHLSSYDYLSLLWLDPALKPAPMSRLPAWQTFADHGVVYWRTSWTSDATALAFKCGPPEGHATARKLQLIPDWHLEAGHAHPDAGSFILFAKGQYLTGDSGYAGIPATDQHNTLLVDGKGQGNEGNGHNAWKDFPYDRLDRITLDEVDVGPGHVYLVANLAAAYPEALGVERFSRRFLLTDPTSITVLDDIETSRPATFTALVHADQAITVSSRGTNFQITRGAAALDLSVLAPASAVAAIEPNWMVRPGRPGSVSHGEREARGQRLTVSTPRPARQAHLALHFDLHDVTRGPPPHSKELIRDRQRQLVIRQVPSRVP
jgi:hypothetical protein